MLEYLRNVSEKPFAKFLIALLAFSFIGWGVAEWVLSGGARDNSLVRVGKAKISVQQFSNEKSRELASMSRDEQRAVYADENATMAFSNKILSNLITQAMVRNRAHDLGFVVSDHRIAREIREYPDFQQDGQFSTILFDYVLSQSGYSEADFANFLRDQITRGMTLGALGAPLPVPQFVVDASYNARYATRDIEYATVRMSDFKATTPSDDQLREFYVQNPQTVPETRSVSYVLVPADMTKPDAYDAAYATALKVEDDIIAGEAFDSTATKHNAKYVAIKPFTRMSELNDKIMDDTMITKVFSMEEGADSELMETKDGFVIVHIDKVVPAHTAEFDSVKNGLIAAWQNDARTKQAYVRANEILVDLNKDGNLANKTAKSVSRTSGAPASVLAAAFNNPISTNIIVPDQDAFYVLSVKGEKTPNVDATKSQELRKELTNAASRQIQDDYNAFLMRTYPAKINQKTYDRFLAK
ncbi:MAG: peptidylprolyl isomerase [Proteobacteria bacterium]|nr:peptidylprolyl isomerase [Candidatus Enterousia scatequi]